MKKLFLTALLTGALCAPAFAQGPGDTPPPPPPPQKPCPLENPEAAKIFDGFKERLKESGKAVYLTRKEFMKAAVSGTADAERKAALDAYSKHLDEEAALRRALKAAGLPADMPLRPRHRDHKHDGPPPAK